VVHILLLTTFTEAFVHFYKTWALASRNHGRWPTDRVRLFTTEINLLNAKLHKTSKASHCIPDPCTVQRFFFHHQSAAAIPSPSYQDDGLPLPDSDVPCIAHTTTISLGTSSQ